MRASRRKTADLAQGARFSVCIFGAKVVACGVGMLVESPGVVLAPVSPDDGVDVIGASIAFSAGVVLIPVASLNDGALLAGAWNVRSAGAFFTLASGSGVLTIFTGAFVMVFASGPGETGILRIFTGTFTSR